MFVSSHFTVVDESGEPGLNRSTGAWQRTTIRQDSAEPSTSPSGRRMATVTIRTAAEAANRKARFYGRGGRSASDATAAELASRYSVRSSSWATGWSGMDPT